MKSIKDECGIFVLQCVIFYMHWEEFIPPGILKEVFILMGTSNMNLILTDIFLNENLWKSGWEFNCHSKHADIFRYLLTRL